MSRDLSACTAREASLAMVLRSAEGSVVIKSPLEAERKNQNEKKEVQPNTFTGILHYSFNAVAPSLSGGHSSLRAPAFVVPQRDLLPLQRSGASSATASWRRTARCPPW